MLLFLSEAAAKTRNGYSQNAVAAIAGVDPRTIRRFEDGAHWPQDLNHILSAYASLADMEDPREIWQMALDEWYRYGANPASLDDQARRIAERVKRKGPPTEDEVPPLVPELEPDEPAQPDDQPAPKEDQPEQTPGRQASKRRRGSK